MESTYGHDAGAVIRRRVFYHGRVQGVGFRMTAAAIAGGLKVVGFVRNLPDGTVELEVEGVGDQVERLLESIQSQFGDHLRDTRTAPLSPSGADEEFRILY